MMKKFNIKKLLMFCVLSISTIAESKSDFEEQLKSLNQLEICCESIKDINFHQLKLKKKKNFQFPDDAQVFKFGEFKSYMSSFELPEDINNTYLELSSVAYGVFNLRAVIPAVIYLNEDHIVTHAFMPNYNIESGLTKAWLRAYAPLPKGTKYVVVFAEGMNADTYNIQKEAKPQILMMGGIPVATHDHEKQENVYHRILEGKMTIRVKKHKK